MGLFRKLFNAGSKPDESYTVTASITTERRINVVGESHYQPAIRDACNWKAGEDTGFECLAELVPEPSNKYDPNAVMVQINGRQVGYLSRDDARELGPFIKASITRQGTGACRAFIAGRADGDTTNLGVFLHLDVTEPV